MALTILEHPLLAARTVTAVLGDVRSSRDLQEALFLTQEERFKLPLATVAQEASNSDHVTRTL